MPAERLLEGGHGRVEIARLRREQATAARAVGERETRSSRRALPSYQSSSSTASPLPTELDQRLDLIDDESRRPGLDDARTANELEARLEGRDCRARSARGQLEVPESRRGHKRVEPARRSRRIEYLCADLTRAHLVPELGGDESLGRAVVGREQRLTGLLRGSLAVPRQAQGREQPSH